jgi:hypothetical protein
MTLRNVTSILATAVLLVTLAQPAMAQTQYEASFDPSTNEVNFSISNGLEETYTVHVVPNGCVTVGSADADSVDMAGPENSGSIPVTCVTPESTGGLSVLFCIGPNCARTINLAMVCRSDCSMHAAGQVPALSTWGIVVLALMLIGSTVWVMRKRRASVH